MSRSGCSRCNYKKIIKNVFRFCMGLYNDTEDKNGRKHKKRRLEIEQVEDKNE